MDYQNETGVATDATGNAEAKSREVPRAKSRKKAPKQSPALMSVASVESMLKRILRTDESTARAIEGKLDENGIAYLMGDDERIYAVAIDPVELDKLLKSTK